ncbi:MAG: acyl-CoA reductase [Bacteroidota bacterium]|nr:acyl-CoA reductase [Bacteroidota bacterium]
MTLTERIESFAELGRILRNSLKGIETEYSSALEKLINKQQLRNPWFTPENVRTALNSIAGELTHEYLKKWTDNYPTLDSEISPTNVGVVMAGNIPLAGFHDFLSVLITGSNIIAKTSSQDPDLIVFIGNILIEINSGFREKMTFTDGLMKDFDAVIATGSNNSSRYFEYYFGKYPHIIRRNRNSIAIIEGDETSDELKLLGSDIFTYFGLGCRSVSKVFVPEGYDVAGMASNWEQYCWMTGHNKYANNYDYNKAIYLVNREEFLDTGYLLMKESGNLGSPVSVLYYEHFKTLDDAWEKAEEDKDKIQCIVSRERVPFGSAQSPRLWDYADGIDTLEFLLKKNSARIL